MAGAGFTTFTAGSVLTAAQVNTYLMQQAVMVFTNEAARDAAITSPSEGMIAYLTAPTVPAATGVTTFVPTGIQTVYNGSSWVCITPVAAYNQTTGTTTSVSYTPTLTSGGTNVSVTITTGTTALIHLYCQAANDTATNSCITTLVVSGATTIAAGSLPITNRSYAHAANSINGQTVSYVVGGLTAGANTFTMNYVVSTGTTGYWYNRSLIVVGTV